MNKLKKSLITIIVVLSLTTFAQVPNYVPINGLVGYWPFTGNATDQSPNLNNGSVSGASLTTDRFGSLNSAYNFNGTTNYISVPSNSTLSGFNDITISVWANISQFTGIQGLVAKWFFSLNCGNNTDSYAGSLVNNTLILTTNYDNAVGFTSPQTFSAGDLNVWKHLVFVSNSAQGISLYINGVLTGTGSFPGTMCNSTNTLFFGTTTATQRFFKGKLDDIGIWNRALTNCEILKLYNSAMINPTSSSNIICSGNSATLTAGGGSTNYLWSTSATSSSIVVSPTVTTTYTVTGTNTITSCSYTSAITQSVSLCTSIQKIDLNNLISIYPNPAKDYLNINIRESMENTLFICIEDVTGKQIFKETINSSDYKIGLGQFEDGMYILKISDIKGIGVKTEKIIIKK